MIVKLAAAVAFVLLAIPGDPPGVPVPSPHPIRTVPQADIFQYPLSSWTPHCLGFGSQWRYCNGVALRACASGVWLHTGVDIRAAVGQPVMAAADGVIIGYLIDPQFHGGVLVRHQTSFGVVITQYWHVWMRAGFTIGSPVKRGQVFANIAAAGGLCRLPGLPLQVRRPERVPSGAHPRAAATPRDADRPVATSPRRTPGLSDHSVS
jgi:hypothetical protein